MRKKIKENPDKLSERPSQKHKDDNPDKRQPNSDDLYEVTRPPIKEISTTVRPDHPHHEEILDTL